MYSKQIDRANPGCIVFLADQSNSMLEGIGGGPRAKIDVVATALNRFIGELVSMCEKGEEKPRHWFDVGLLGYTTDKTGGPVVGSAWGGGLAGRDLVGIPDLYDAPLEVEKRTKKEFQDDGAGGLTEIQVEINFPVWYRSPGKDQMYGTPMCGAFANAHQILSNWITAHPDSFPPLVLNLTDGEPTDGDPEQLGLADQLKGLATSDGNLLLFNCHLSSHPAESVFLPTNEGQLPDELGKALFRMSSTLPDKMRQMAEVKGIAAPMGCKATAFNADAVSLLKMLSVGTVVADNALPKHLR